MRSLFVVLALALFCPVPVLGQFQARNPALQVAGHAPGLLPVRLDLTAPDLDAELAAWVFARFRDSDGNWRDVRWAESGHAVRPQNGGGAGIEVIPGTGGPFVPGVFLVVSDLGEARNGAEWELELLWDYSTSQIEMPEEGLEIRVHSVDMVRVPAGTFPVGATRGEAPSVLFGPDGGPYVIASEGSLAVGPEGLQYDASDYGGDQAGPIPADFPTGFGSFFIMRNEVSDAEYALFLSYLSGRARASRDVSLSPGYRQAGGTIRVEGSRIVGDSLRAASHLTWADGTAWAAWAGLRPMSELEFEKAAHLADDLGIRDLTSGRWERAVSLGNDRGRAFRGSHGLGFLDDLGQPYAFVNEDWPGPMAVGSGFRGGADGLDDLSGKANRVYATYDATYGAENEGFRAVRSAPAGGR